MKKLICLLVICANLVGVAVNVSAYSDYDTEETRFLRVMDIMNGYEDGTFKPYNVLTRSEAIRIVDDMMGFNDETSYTGKKKIQIYRLVTYQRIRGIGSIGIMRTVTV